MSKANEFNFFFNDPTLCGDCPPMGYPTDKTRCLPCPRRIDPTLDNLPFAVTLEGDK